jgi:hypothetical protein
MKKFAIISTCLNNPTEWELKHRQSVDFQTLRHEARHWYIDAAKQPIPMSSLANVVNMVSECDPETIVCWLDGDDWFATPTALERVATEYDKGAWMTWGQFRYWPGGEHGWARDWEPDAHRCATHRNWVWRMTHLKTFRAGLFQAIPEGYLCKNFGKDTPHICPNYFTRATDNAVMFPMIDMARERGHFIPDVLVEYNSTNVGSAHNDPRIQAEENEQVRIIRAMPPLPRLDKQPW